MHVEQSPNSPYRSAQDHGLPSSCLFTCYHFHGMGVQPHSWEPQLPPPARPVREREQSSEMRLPQGNPAKDAQRSAGITEEPAQQPGC